MEASPIRRSTDVERCIEGWFRHAETGDAEWRDRHVSRRAELRLIGTEAPEFLSGEAAYGFLSDAIPSEGTGASIDIRHLEGFQTGDVGWGVAVVEANLPDGRNLTLRWSAVLHREDETWKLVQIHASVPEAP